MGSSRRNKGRQRGKEFTNEDTVVDESPETAKMSATETTRPEELLQESEHDAPLSVPYDSSMFTVSTPAYSTEVQNPTAASYPEISWESFTGESENLQEDPNHTVLNVHSDEPAEAGMEDVEKQEDTELLTQNANLQGNNLLSRATECMITTEITTEKSSLRGSSDVEGRVVQETFLLSKDVLTTNGEQHEHHNPAEVSRAQQSDSASMHQTDYISITDREYSQQAPLAETNTSLDFQSHNNSQSITEVHTALSRAGNRKKLGSSRRNKGRQCVSDTDAYQELKDEVVENPTSDEALKTVKMSPSTDIAKEEQADDLISTEKAMQISSAANEDENTKKLSDKDLFFLQNDMDSSEIVTSDSNSNNDDFLNSNKDFNEQNKPAEETEDLDQLTGCDTVTKHLMQSPHASVCNVASDMQHISYHDGIISSSSVEVLDKEEAFQIQNATTPSSDKDLLGQQFEDMNTSNKVVSAAKEPALRASDGMAICTAMHASNNQQEQTQSSDRNNLQINPKQKRRKMGSTRRTQLNRKNEEETDSTDETRASELNAEVYMRNLDKMDAAELLLTTEVSENETAQPLFSAVHKQQETDEATSVPSSTESNVTPVEEFKAPLPKQSTSLSEETISPATCAKVGDVRGDIVKLPQLDDCTNAEMQITTMVVGRSRRSINQLLPPNTEAATDTGITEGSLASSTEARQATQSDTEKPGSVKVTQDQDTNEKKSNDLNDEALDKNPEMRNSSPNLNSTNRRRKMGSTRKNLGSRNKEGLYQEQEVGNEAKEMGTNVADTESFPGITEELQLHIEPKDSDREQAKEKVFETVEISPPGQSQVKSLAEQTVEERPDSQGHPVETEHRLTANYLPSTSPNNDVVSGTASGRKKRKMGSSRKIRGHQPTEDQTAEGEIIDDQNGTDAKISEAEESDKKPSLGISESGEHIKAVSEKTSAKPCNAEIFLGQESQTLSLVGDPGGTDLKSKRYDVVMIGDSSVGKTSFMKRAQSGKFSLDLPASIGLDSLIWPVVVDGKPLVLQLWDTAGQERFHSITKQVFHKARAFLLMYDITSTKSFSAVSYWANCIQESAAENAIVLLLGNKNDCSQRQVKTHQGEILAKEYDFEFMECSAATGENVIQSLEIVARKLSQRIDTREEATVLHKQPEQKKSSRCC